MCGEKLFQFTCLSSGLSTVPRIFTKITKLIYSALRKKGHLNVPYINDSYLQGDSVAEYRADVIESVQIGLNAGFVIHPLKSVFEPTQTLTYLGFVLDSVRMIVYMTREKSTRLKEACIALLQKQNLFIQELSEVAGQMVASFPGVEFAQLHYRLLDNGKTAALENPRANLMQVIFLVKVQK